MSWSLEELVNDINQHPEEYWFLRVLNESDCHHFVACIEPSMYKNARQLTFDDWRKIMEKIKPNLTANYVVHSGTDIIYRTKTGNLSPRVGSKSL